MKLCAHTGIAAVLSGRFPAVPNGHLKFELGLCVDLGCMC